MLDEMFQQNTSKFARFLEYKNSCRFFVQIYFPPNEEGPGLYRQILKYFTMEHFIKHIPLFSEEWKTKIEWTFFSISAQTASL